MSTAMKTAYESALKDTRKPLSDEELLPAEAELENLLTSDNGVVVMDRISALERIKQMWDDFDLDEYLQIHERPSGDAAACMELENAANVGAASSETPTWKHRVTIPQPFDMTIRDEIAERRKKEKMENMRREKKEEERMIESQLQAKRHFRANPVPAHVYLPIYDELERAQEQRRQFVVEHSQQLLRSLQKPFKFTLREHTSRSLQRCSSATQLDKTTPSATFKARPIPPSTNDPTVIEQLRERELYRKIQGRMRAIDLYRSAAAPPSMEARRKAQQDLLADSLRKRAPSSDRSRYIPANSDVFNRLSQPVVRPPLPTRSKFVSPPPVNFADETPVERKSRPRSAADSLVAGRRALRGDAAPPTKLTATSELRMSLMKEKVAAEKANFERDQALRHQRERRQKEMARLVRERSMGYAVDDGRAGNDNSERQRDMHEKAVRYRRYLADVDHKLADRPLLVERVSADRARKKAAQRYREALERAGLTEEDVLQSTTLGDDFGTSLKYGSPPSLADVPFRNNEVLDDFPPDIPASPIPPYSPEDDYAY